MDHINPHYMGPPPFRFTPSDGLGTSAAFSIVFKVLATALVMACGAGLLQAWVAGRVQVNTVGGGWFFAAIAIMAYTWWHILRSATRIDSSGLYQSWLWDKHMDLRELAYAKVIRIRGLEWLIAPRLYVRTLMGKFAVFYASSPAMIAEFDRLAAELKVFRNQR